MRRWTVRAGGLVVGIALAGLVSVVAAPPASAHAELTRSTPADGATLRVAPGELVLSFSESVERHATHVRLTDGHGREVAPGALRFVKTSGAGMETSSAAIISLPPLAPDVYRVAWRTLSSDDLHSTDGVFVFGLQRAVGAQAAVPRDPPPGSAEVALRWLTLLSMACAFGAGALLSLMDDRAAAGATVRAVRLRLLGLVQAGDDGNSNFRGMGRTVSAGAVGHNGAKGQIAWGDPASGLSLGYCTNGLDEHFLREARRTTSIASHAGSCGTPD